jgi:GNAT superfamily N-acetyltransferase
MFEKPFIGDHQQHAAERIPGSPRRIVASIMVLHPLTVGNARFRAGGWRGSPDTAYLVPLTGAVTLDTEVLRRTRAALAADGFTSVVTAAVGPAEQHAFVRDGFAEREQLHLLRHDLATIPSPPPDSPRVRRGTRRDRGAVLRVDADAFQDFWRLDAVGLEEALRATPVSRLRVIRRPGVVAYAVSGRAGRHGYLQRLAVDPGEQAGGLGRTLVIDTLTWLRRRDVTSALVNTQRTNERALTLYERLGFVHEPHGLTVLQRELT